MSNMVLGDASASKNDSVHFVTVLERRMNENEDKNVGKVADLDALEAGSRSRSGLERAAVSVEGSSLASSASNPVLSNSL